MKQRNTWSVGAAYAAAAARRRRLRASDNSKTGATDPTAGKWQSTDDGLFNSSINEGYASAQSQQIIATGATTTSGRPSSA